MALGNTILGVATAPEHRFSPWCTLRAARFDPLKVGKGLVLVGLPFEPTTRGGYAVETHALGLPNAPDHAVVACLAGDYIGYLVTREEYAAQMYEGGSSWFGRNTLRWVTDNLGDLLANPPERKFAEAWFSSRPKSIAADVRVPPPNPNLTPLDQVSDHWKIDAAAIAQGPDGADWLTVGGMWTAVATKTDHPRAGQDPWIRLMLRSGSTGQPEQARLDTNVPANDKCGWILLYRDIRAGEAFVRWRWQFHGPLPSTWKGKQLTFQILTALDGVAPHEVTTKWVKVG